MTESDRVSFGNLTDIITPPYLIEMQTSSFREFLQADVAPNERRDVGLESVFRRAFPIESYDSTVSLNYVSYRIAELKYKEDFCLREGRTYAASLYITDRVRTGRVLQEADHEKIMINMVKMINMLPDD